LELNEGWDFKNAAAAGGRPEVDENNFASEVWKLRRLSGVVNEMEIRRWLAVGFRNQRCVDVVLGEGRESRDEEERGDREFDRGKRTAGVEMGSRHGNPLSTCRIHRFQFGAGRST
jgi:hypothetical protein